MKFSFTSIDIFTRSCRVVVGIDRRDKASRNVGSCRVIEAPLLSPS